LISEREGKQGQGVTEKNPEIVKIENSSSNFWEQIIFGNEDGRAREIVMGTSQEHRINAGFFPSTFF